MQFRIDFFQNIKNINAKAPNSVNGITNKAKIALTEPGGKPKASLGFISISIYPINLSFFHLNG